MSKGNKACVSFLQWALPKLEMRWEGYKKVRGQVCTRINKRLQELGLEDYDAYKYYLEKHHDEWQKLDEMTHITISRFFRDKKQWDVLEQDLLPELAEKAGNRPLRVWCAGCAGGEEPYSFAILWKEAVAQKHQDARLEIIATDADEQMLKRAGEALYTGGSLKEMPAEWKQKAFVQEHNSYHLKKEYRGMVNFKKQDIRTEMPEEPFDIIFCKNLVAMYFDEQLAVKLFEKIIGKIRSGAFLFLGNHEKVPTEIVKGIREYDRGINLYKKE
jgi:chemotaxis protein methyltransferase CheR